MTQYVIIMTVGQHDLQVVFPSDGADPACRYEIAKESVRTFHKALMEERFPYRLLPLEQTRGLRRGGRTVTFDEQTLSLKLRLEERDEPYDCTAGVTLCAPLLCDLEKVWKETVQREPDSQIVRVVILTTRRNETHKHALGEPIAAAEILRGYFVNEFSLQEDQVEECIFLKDDENLYEYDSRGRAVILEVAARRIDDVTYTYSRQYPGAKALINDVAGLPEVKLILATSARYQFRDRVVFLRTPEDREEKRSRKKAVIYPEDTLAIQAKCLDLVEHGAFHAAHALAKLCDREVRKREPWRDILGAIVAWLNGSESEPPIKKEVCERSSAIGWLQGHLTGENNWLLRAAFSTENDLRSREWVPAVRNTSSFSEQTQMMKLNRLLSADPSSPCIECENGYHVLKPKRVAASLASRLPAELQGREEPITLTEKLRPNARTTVIRELASAFSAELGVVKDFVDKLSGPFRTLRNLSMHGTYNAVHVEDAKQDAFRKGIWRQEPPHFLGGDMVKQILGEFGIADPVQEYELLIDSLVCDMIRFALGRNGQLPGEYTDT